MSGNSERAGAPGGHGAHTVVLLQTHYLDRALASRFRRLQATCPPGYAAVLLMHVPPGTAPPPLLDTLPHHFVTTPEVRTPDYPGKSGGGPEWSIWRDGHVDLPVLHFFRAHPGFDRYWVVEYDVRFTGRWSTLFGAFDESGADFLSTALRRAEDDPRWPSWGTLRGPQPWDGANLRDRVCSFMPIYRASVAAMRTMDAAYREGWTGHLETVWPTLLLRAGLTVEDIGGDGPFVRPGNRNRHYTCAPLNRDLQPGTFAFLPALPCAGPRRNRLYHPVKPLPSGWAAKAKAVARACRELARRRALAARGAGQDTGVPAASGLLGQGAQT